MSEPSGLRTEKARSRATRTGQDLRGERRGQGKRGKKKGSSEGTREEDMKNGSRLPKDFLPSASGPKIPVQTFAITS